MSFATRRLSALPDAIAPDRSEVRILCSTSGRTLGAGRSSLKALELNPRGGAGVLQITLRLAGRAGSEH